MDINPKYVYPIQDCQTNEIPEDRKPDSTIATHINANNNFNNGSLLETNESLDSRLITSSDPITTRLNNTLVAETNQNEQMSTTSKNSEHKLDSASRCTSEIIAEKLFDIKQQANDQKIIGLKPDSVFDTYTYADILVFAKILNVIFADNMLNGVKLEIIISKETFQKVLSQLKTFTRFKYSEVSLTKILAGIQDINDKKMSRLQETIESAINNHPAILINDEDGDEDEDIDLIGEYELEAVPAKDVNDAIELLKTFIPPEYNATEIVALLADEHNLHILINNLKLLLTFSNSDYSIEDLTTISLIIDGKHCEMITNRLTKLVKKLIIENKAQAETEKLQDIFDFFAIDGSNIHKDFIKNAVLTQGKSNEYYSNWELAELIDQEISVKDLLNYKTNAERQLIQNAVINTLINYQSSSSENNLGASNYTQDNNDSLQGDTATSYQIPNEPSSDKINDIPNILKLFDIDNSLLSENFITQFKNDQSFLEKCYSTWGIPEFIISEIPAEEILKFKTIEQIEQIRNKIIDMLLDHLASTPKNNSNASYQTHDNNDGLQGATAASNQIYNNTNQLKQSDISDVEYTILKSRLESIGKELQELLESNTIDIAPAIQEYANDSNDLAILKCIIERILKDSANKLTIANFISNSNYPVILGILQSNLNIDVREFSLVTVLSRLRKDTQATLEKIHSQVLSEISPQSLKQVSMSQPRVYFELNQANIDVAISLISQFIPTKYQFMVNKFLKDDNFILDAVKIIKTELACNAEDIDELKFIAESIRSNQTEQIQKSIKYYIEDYALPKYSTIPHDLDA